MAFALGPRATSAGYRLAAFDHIGSTNAEAMEATLEDAYVLIHEKKISSLQDLLPLLQTVAKSGTSAPTRTPAFNHEYGFKRGKKSSIRSSFAGLGRGTGRRPVRRSH